jgi:hypothetical protein
MAGQPSRTQVHIDVALTNFAQAYASQFGYVASAIPTIPVGKQSNKYFTFDPAEWYRNSNGPGPRGPATESRGGGFTVSTDTYFCNPIAFHQDVDEQTLRNADDPIDLMRDAARFVGQQMALYAEVEFVGAFIGQSVWGGSGAPSPTWDDVSSTPIENVRAQSNAIIEKTGFKPNTMIVGAEVHKRLVDHPDIIDRIKYTEKGIASADLLASLFEVDKYMIHYATANTAQEQATASYDFLGNSGKNALLLHLNPGANLVSAPTALTRFQWSGLGVDRFELRELKATRVEAEMAFDYKVTGSTLGYEFTSAVAS